jgi:hypothetical protein
MQRQDFRLFIIAAITLLCSTQAMAWKIKTHGLLSQRAAEHSRTNTTNYLQQIGLEGLEQSIWLGNTLKKIVVWIQDGAEREDAGNIFEQIAGRGRFTNHFHHPLEPFEQAGLHDFQTGMSSLLWAQASLAQETFPEGDWSWQIIREYYYYALTAPTVLERQEHFARTFRGLGHQMHFIQDAAQPDHARNDAHPVDAFWGYNRFGSLLFESWAAKNPGIIEALAATPLFPAIDLTIGWYGMSYGLAGISQLIDTDQYDGIAPTDSLAQGMAEYTNANFFSDDTLFAAERYAVGHKYYSPYPKQSSTNLQDYLDQRLLPETVVTKDGMSGMEFWIAKTQDGERIDHFVKPTYFTADIYQAEKRKGSSGVIYRRTFYRDEESHKAYASKLVPRAVGYSAALIDYFFRGDITIEQEDMGPGYVIVNHTAEDMDGTFALYYDNKQAERVLLWSETFPLGAKDSGTNRSHPIDIAGPVDADRPGEYMLVFQGRLGAEEDAVIGRVAQLVTTLTGRLVDSEGRSPAGVTVVAVAGAEPHLLKRAGTSDANGVFVIENFPADRGDIHIEVWEKCQICRTPREGKGSMIPQSQLLPFQTFYIYEPGIFWTDMLYFPPMQYRSKTAELPPLLKDTVDFGDVPVEYVSVVFEKITVPGLRGVDLGIWGSFPGEVYIYPGTSTVIKEDFEPVERYMYPDHIPVTSQCPADNGPRVTLPWRYTDMVASLTWFKMPYIAQGRHLPAFDDVDGQIIGQYAAEFLATIAGDIRPPEDCDWVTPFSLGPSFQTVRKTDLKVTVKVYR